MDDGTQHPKTSAKVRFSLRISGRVQGVNYRRDARREAERLGLTGFVNNEAEGSVYAEAEGTASGVGTFIRWCRKGSPNACVEAVETQELPTKEDSGFEIRY